MAQSGILYTGGCLCGALRYEATAEPRLMGYCYCADCRKASGSGFIPFMGFAAGTLSIKGETWPYASPALRGTATRNSCRRCASLVFGGNLGNPEGHTVYAGSLDDPSAFRPSVAIFNRDRPHWVALPPGLKV